MYPKRNRGNDWWQQRKIFKLNIKSIILPSTNGTLHKPSTHTNTFRVRFELPNNEIVLPTDTINSTQNENPRRASTYNIEGKLLLHFHTDLLCIVNRVYTVNNKPLVRLYYCTRHGLPTTYIIPPLPSLATTCRLLKLYEDHARSTHNDPVYSPYMSSLTSSRQEEYNSSYTVYHHSLNTRVIIKHFTGNPVRRYEIGLKTDTISNLVPKIYCQAMKSAESAEWQKALMLNFNPCRQMMFEIQNLEYYPRTTYCCTQSKTMFRYLLIFPPRKKYLSLLVLCFVVLRSYFTMIP